MENLKSLPASTFEERSKSKVKGTDSIVVLRVVADYSEL